MSEDVFAKLQEIEEQYQQIQDDLEELDPDTLRNDHNEIEEIRNLLEEHETRIETLEENFEEQDKQRLKFESMEDQIMQLKKANQFLQQQIANLMTLQTEMQCKEFDQRRKEIREKHALPQKKIETPPTEEEEEETFSLTPEPLRFLVVYTKENFKMAPPDSMIQIFLFQRKSNQIDVAPAKSIIQNPAALIWKSPRALRACQLWSHASRRFKLQFPNDWQTPRAENSRWNNRSLLIRVRLIPNLVQILNTLEPQF
jgi:hypothetical protein